MTTPNPFLALLAQHGLPAPIQEYTFAPPRRWRFDYAWPAERLALEVEGGVFVGGRHSRGVGMLKDMAKYNAAVLLGWRVLRVVPRELATPATVDLLRQVLRLEVAA
jgi:hypothetical protein